MAYFPFPLYVCNWCLQWTCQGLFLHSASLSFCVNMQSIQGSYTFDPTSVLVAFCNNINLLTIAVSSFILLFWAWFQLLDHSNSVLFMDTFCFRVDYLHIFFKKWYCRVKQIKSAFYSLPKVFITSCWSLFCLFIHVDLHFAFNLLDFDFDLHLNRTHHHGIMKVLRCK